MKKNNIDINNIAIDTTRQTTEKMRIIVANQHITRLDKESIEYISESTEKELLEKISAQMPHCDAIIISDYAKV